MPVGPGENGSALAHTACYVVFGGLPAGADRRIGAPRLRTRRAAALVVETLRPFLVCFRVLVAALLVHALQGVVAEAMECSAGQTDHDSHPARTGVRSQDCLRREPGKRHRLGQHRGQQRLDGRIHCRAQNAAERQAFRQFVDGDSHQEH